MRNVRTTYLVAGAIALLGITWLFSGILADTADIEKDLTIAEESSSRQTIEPDDPKISVKAVESRSTLQHRILELRGRTKNKRTVVVRAQTAGKLIERSVEAGDRVAKDDTLCTIETGDRKARLDQAKAAVHRARRDHEASLRLKDQAFQSESAIARAFAALKAVEADLKMRKLDLQRTRITAPFDGLVEAIHVSTGDLMAPGQSCITLVDLDPMLVVSHASERDVDAIPVGSTAETQFVDGSLGVGKVTFVSSIADPITRTYRVEVTLRNTDYIIRSGLTATMRLELAEQHAHLVRTSLFGLDDQGNIGIRIVDRKDRVQFVPVTIIRETADGVWVAGLPHFARIITVGQEYAFPGQVVEVVLDQSRNRPSDLEANRTSAKSDPRPNQLRSSGEFATPPTGIDAQQNR